MIIIDTNVLVSGLLTSNAGAPTARILDAALDGRLRCLLSPALLQEYRAVLLRPAIVRRHGLDAADIDELLAALVHNAAWREPTGSYSAPDPGDNHLWALLESEPSAHLITGDQRLLGGQPFDARVLRPDQFRDWVGS